jgi:hypothetical protein
MTLRTMLMRCGLPDIANGAGTRPTQAFIDSQGFMDIQDFTIMAVKDVPNMIKNHNSISGQSVVLGAVHQRKIQALIYWARDQKRRGITIVANEWTQATMADSIERVNSDIPPRKWRGRGKLR